MELKDELTLPRCQRDQAGTGGGLVSSCQLALPQQKASPRLLANLALILPIPPLPKVPVVLAEQEACMCVTGSAPWALPPSQDLSQEGQTQSLASPDPHGPSAVLG